MMCVSCNKSAWRNAVLSIKPMGKVCSHCIKRITEIYLNQAPLQRTWVGLTDVEIDYLLGSTAGENEETHISFARAIESKLKELNT